MPSLNFQQQFVPGILAMLDKEYARRNKVVPKTTTIRAKRKNTIKLGDKLYLFWALRTKQCQRLGEAYCRKIETIFIDESREGYIVKIDGKQLAIAEAQDLAVKDGFEKLSDFVRWFKIANKGLPFVGDRIHFTTTYDRKYFCNKQVKQRGFKLNLEQTSKTIQIDPDHVEAAKGDRYVRELTQKYQYGAQIMNPILKLVDTITD